MPAFDDDGYPLQKSGVTEFSGLYFIGLPFLPTIKSGLLAGVGEVAAHVAGHINSRIKIQEAGGGVVYDNKMGKGDNSNATTDLGGGSIVIHSR